MSQSAAHRQQDAGLREIAQRLRERIDGGIDAALRARVAGYGPGSASAPVWACPPIPGPRQARTGRVKP